MNAIATLGRMLYAAALVLLGVEHLVNANFPVGLFPIPPGVPGRLVLVYLAGSILVVAGVGFLVKRFAWSAAIAVSGLFGLVALLVQLPLLVAAPASGGVWTALFECLALSGGALVLASQSGKIERVGWLELPRFGRWLFAISLVVFAILHFVYAPFIATLIPGWIPAPLFLAYFVGAAFAATALSIFLDRHRTLGTGMLGLMFLLWVLILHGPRVAANPQLEPEWTSLCVALSMSGIGFGLAGLSVNRRPIYLDFPRP